MAKRKQYDLVGYVYDKYNRFNKYLEEEIIKIPGVTFNSLEDIDRFTASFSSFYEFSNSLDDKYQKKTNFSIRITDNNGRYSYRSVIYNVPNLSEVIDKLKQGTIKVLGKKRTVNLYTGSSKYFRDIWKKVKKKILEEDRDWCSQVFSDSWYLTLINQYFNRDPFESSPDISILDLERAFKDYSVFRKYITYKDNSIVSNLNVTTSNIPTGTTISTASNSKSTDIEVYDDKYEPDYINLLTPEEREKAYGEGNEDIEEYRHRRRR